MSVVSCETVIRAQKIATLNGIEAKAADILNAYVTTPVQDKVWKILGPKFEEGSGKKNIIVRYLYGMKSAWTSF